MTKREFYRTPGGRRLLTFRQRFCRSCASWWMRRSGGDWRLEVYER